MCKSLDLPAQEIQYQPAPAIAGDEVRNLATVIVLSRLGGLGRSSAWKSGSLENGGQPHR
jgi:hypothetical protein